MTSTTSMFEQLPALMTDAVKQAGGAHADATQLWHEVNTGLENLVEKFEGDLSRSKIGLLVREGYRQAFFCLIAEINCEAADWMGVSFYLLDFPARDLAKARTAHSEKKA